MLIRYLLDRLDGSSTEQSSYGAVRLSAVVRAGGDLGLIPRPANLIASGVFSKADVLPPPHQGWDGDITNTPYYYVVGVLLGDTNVKRGRGFLTSDVPEVMIGGRLLVDQ